jgi:WD40 repeat protein
LEFQDACRDATRDDPELPLPVGIGIAAGEAVPVEAGFRGAALNLAARLCSKAAGGQVLVTNDVAGETAEAGDLSFTALEAVELKGFDRPVELLEAGSTARAAAPPEPAPPGAVPPGLDDPTPLAGREPELRWLRGTWRQARRGHGRLVFVSGPAGIGKTRLVGELAVHVAAGGRDGGAVRYAGAGGAGDATALAVVAEAETAGSPTLCVLDDLDLHSGAIERLTRLADSVGSAPVLLVGVLQEAPEASALAALVERADVRGDGHRRLGPIGADDVAAIAEAAVGALDEDEFPAESILRTSGGVPARVHEAVEEWAREEASRRLEAAAEFLSEGRARQAAGLDFAGNLIARNLGRIYRTPAADASDADGAACPYRGLAPFGEADAPYFFGRERLVGEVAARTVGTGLLGVVGPSGSGKSSLVMAGLLPSLAAGLLPGSERWGQVVLRPGEHPVDALESALLSAAPGTRLVVVVDQFEETFTTAADDGERKAFVDRVVDLATEPEGTVVVLTIRADFTGHCAPYPELARLLAANLVLVGPMTPEETRRAIELPARRGGLRVESALSDALVEEVGDEPGALPLLSTALVELWQAREGGWLRLEARERTGGIRGAVARLADASYAQLNEAEREAARTVLLRLVGEGEGDSAVRRRVSVDEFDLDRDPAVAAVLTRLTDDRLLTRDDGQVEIAHEALIREWPRLRGWLEDDVAGRQLRGHLTQSARQWDGRGRDPGDLYRGARLSATLDWALGHDRELNDLEREFLAESRQGSEHEAERQRRTNRRLRGLLVGTAVFLVVALVAGALALVQRGRARDAQTGAEAQALRSDAERVGTLAQTEPNLDRKMLLAVAAVQLQDLPETRSDLLALLQANPSVFRVIFPSDVEISAVAISPDGRLLASGDTAGVVRFQDLTTWTPVGEPLELGGAVSAQALEFAPDGGTLAVAANTDDTSTVYRIDVAGQTSTPVLERPSSPAFVGPIRFTRLAFSPSGSRLAVAIATAETFSPVPTKQSVLMLDWPGGGVEWEAGYPTAGENEALLAYPNENLLATSAQQGSTRLYDPDTGALIRAFDHGGPIAVTPDGRTAALPQDNADPAFAEATMATLDLRTGDLTELKDLPVSGWIVSVRFTPDGKHILGGSFDGAVRMWDLDTGRISRTFAGQPSGLNLALSADGGTLVTGGVDGSVAAFDLAGTQSLGRTYRWHPSDAGCPTAPCFVVDPKGGTLMATDNGVDGTVSLFDLAKGKVVGVLPAGEKPQTDALAFSPDGATLVTGDIAGSVKLWDVASRTVQGELPPFTGAVSWVAVSPDGSLLGVQTTRPNAPQSQIDVFDMDSLERRYQRNVPGGTGGLEFSPEGGLLAALGCCEPDSTIRVWDAETGAQRYERVGGQAASIAFSPDGRVLAAGTKDGKVVLRRARDGSQIGSPFAVAGGSAYLIDFSPDGRLLAVAADDQTASVWDLATRKRIGTSFPPDPASVPVARFTSGGDLVIDNLSNTAVWPTDLDAWVDYACDVAGRDLTPGEWRDLLPDRPYEHVCPQ